MPKYQITGEHEASGRATQYTVEAGNAAIAADLARANGVRVGNVELATDAAAPVLSSPTVLPAGCFWRGSYGSRRPVPIEQVEMADLISVRDGKPYIRVEVRDLTGNIAVGVVVGAVLLAIVLMVAGGL